MQCFIYVRIFLVNILLAIFQILEIFFSLIAVEFHVPNECIEFYLHSFMRSSNYTCSMISSCETQEQMTKLSTDGQMMLDAIANHPKPSVAAIMGSCLGGGLEVTTAPRQSRPIISTARVRKRSRKAAWKYALRLNFTSFCGQS